MQILLWIYSEMMNYQAFLFSDKPLWQVFWSFNHFYCQKEFSQMIALRGVNCPSLSCNKTTPWTCGPQQVLAWAKLAQLLWRYRDDHTCLCRMCSVRSSWLWLSPYFQLVASFGCSFSSAWRDWLPNDLPFSFENRNWLWFLRICAFLGIYSWVNA